MMGKENSKVEPPLILPFVPIEDEPMSSSLTVEKTKVTSTDTSPPIPSLVSEEETKEIVLQPTGDTGSAEERNLT
jgi:hypothetical protein